MQEAEEAAEAMSKTTLTALIASLNNILAAKQTRASGRMAEAVSSGKSSQDDNTLVERALQHFDKHTAFGEDKGDVEAIPPPR